jgi:hypothetical protein
MKNYRELTEVEFDRLIEGVGPAWDPALGDLNTLVQEVRGAYLRPISRTAEMRHIEAMVKEAHSGNWRSSLSRQLEGMKASLGPLFRTPSLRMRRIILANLMGSALGKAVLAVTAAAATTTGLAATGSLPPPIQAVVISAAHNLGMSSPPEIPAPVRPPAPLLPPNPSPEVPVAEPVAPHIEPEAALPAVPEQRAASSHPPSPAGGLVAPGRKSQTGPGFMESGGDTRSRGPDETNSGSAPASGENGAYDWWNQNQDHQGDGQTGSGQGSGRQQKDEPSAGSWGSWSWYSQNWWNSWEGSSGQAGRR